MGRHERFNPLPLGASAPSGFFTPVTPEKIPLNHLPDERTLRIVAAIIDGHTDEHIRQTHAVTVWRVSSLRESAKKAGLR